MYYEIFLLVSVNVLTQKLERNYFQKVHRNKNTSKRDVQTTLIFDVSKTYQKRYETDHDVLSFKTFKINTSKLLQFFIHRNFMEKIHQNKVDFWSIEKGTSRQHWLFAYRNYVGKSTSKRCRFFTHRNSEEGMWKRRRFFSHQNIIEKVRRSDVEIRRYFVFDVSTLNRCWFHVLCPLELEQGVKHVQS